MTKIAIIGSSTGGIRVLTELFSSMPLLDGSIIIVQHILKFVNRTLCDRLDDLTEMSVKLAQQGETLEPATVYLAPSGVHLEIIDNQTIRLFRGEKVNFVCPSIDVTMESLQKKPGHKLIGVILTGMGSDGAMGIRHIKRLGGVTIAQDKKTSAVYGMPRIAYETGDVDYILSPNAIRRKLIELLGVVKK